MTDLKTNGYACDVIENEGLSYAVQDYCSGSTFKDPTTAELWDAAEAALDTLVRYLETETGRVLS